MNLLKKNTYETTPTHWGKKNEAIGSRSFATPPPPSWIYLPLALWVDTAQYTAGLQGFYTINKLIINTVLTFSASSAFDNACDPT